MTGKQLLRGLLAAVDVALGADLPGAVHKQHQKSQAAQQQAQRKAQRAAEQAHLDHLRDSMWGVGGHDHGQDMQRWADEALKQLQGNGNGNGNGKGRRWV